MKNVVPNARALRSRCDREIRQQSIGSHPKSQSGKVEKNIGFGTLAVDLDQVDSREPDFAQDVI